MRAADIRDHYLPRAGKRPVLLPDEMDEAIKLPRGQIEVGASSKGLNPE